MQLTVKIDSTALLAAFMKAPEEVSRKLRSGMSRAVNTIATEARANHPTFTSRSNMAERSITTTVDPSGLVGRVQLDNGIAYYAKYLHEGTGLYRANSPDYIRPKEKRILSWRSRSGARIFARKVPGVRAGKFIYNAFERVLPWIEHEVNLSIQAAYKAAGFERVSS